jgi:hypothetical protein
MFSRYLVLALASAALLCTTAARAEIYFFANLTMDQEVGVNTPANPALLPVRQGPADLTPRPLSFGTANLLLNNAQNALTMSITIFNIDVTGNQTPYPFDNLVAAHIHAPAPPGAPAGVVWGFFGLPFHDTNQGVGDIVPFANGVGGVFNLTWDLGEGAGAGLAGQLGNILNGLAYLNFHTTQFTGGEIRGQILAIPEPATIVLLALALLAVSATGRRRR